MSILSLLNRHFAADVRSRGFGYVSSNSVRIVQGASDGVWGTVRGSSTYQVALSLEEDELHATCSCPYFIDRGSGCKHLWATIVIADRHGYLSELACHPNFDMIFDDDESGEVGAFDSDDDPGFGDVLDGRAPAREVSAKPKKRAAKKTASSPEWSQTLNQIKRTLQAAPVRAETVWPAGRRLLYVIDAPSSQSPSGLVLDLGFQDPKKDGAWSKPKFQGIPVAQAEKIEEEGDAAALAYLFGAAKSDSYGYYGSGYSQGTTRFTLSAARCQTILPLIGKTGRLFLRLGWAKEEIAPIRWDDGPAWQLRLGVEAAHGGKNYRVSGWLCRGEQRVSVAEPASILPIGIALWNDRAALVDDGGAPAWIGTLRQAKVVSVAANQTDAFLRDLLLMPQLPPVDLPSELRVTQDSVSPRPKIVIKAAKEGWHKPVLNAVLAFEYAEQVIAFASPERGVFDAKTRRLLVRDAAAEQAAGALLGGLGFRAPRYYERGDGDFVLPPRQLPKATRALLEAGWHVEAEGKLYRSSGKINIEVTTGIDWFDLEGDVQFDDQIVPLPRLLQALKKGESTIQLDDGTFGMLPEDWLKKYGMLSGLGAEQDGQLRFSRMQAGLLDALLATLPEVSVDEAFRKVAEELRRFEGIKAVEPPPEFVGTLREYQREGLGWLQFLERFGFGGCLADDMGLGKTVQVLALLAERTKTKKPKEKKLPTLIVVPRSLVFNWQQEAARFAPQLKILDHTGLARGKTTEHFPDFDIVVTTYGTLRRDVLLFKDAKFDYCILDEAQVVKNAGTDQAKATRLLQANHRLALSGTPVENHLGELWSLFEFLNPGLLGHASVFKLAGGAARNPEPETRAILAKGLRPFILRRTKQQVAKDLPDKTEQTLYCELEPEQRKLYDELRDHYRQSLLKTIEAVGMNRAKIQVLEALLRLRQAACHPGLIDKKKSADASAKLDLLFPYLEEAIDEGQKTLVFSQFTSFLAIVRAQLDRAGIAYEYLDGKTRNRQEKVERFQNDPDCKLFLISLKAGGVGLNLTAAEYVFLLDPWWNPAVEAQAIDRTHRIGQTKPVFAYRLIAKNTVEEKVLELQKTKRDLADAILNADNSVISDLKREDLEMLLS